MKCPSGTTAVGSECWKISEVKVTVRQGPKCKISGSRVAVFKKLPISRRDVRRLIKATVRKKRK
jgi:ribosomal protein S14